MTAPLLLSVKDATVSYTDVPVFRDLSFNIHEGARIALVGRNGAGKSTLMNVITGDQELDDGERWESPGLSIGYLRQEVRPRPGQSVYEYIFSNIEIKEDYEEELHAYKIDIVCDALSLDKNTDMGTLSGGQVRRAGLARALVEEPDILLLDEPTNHLDIAAIEWLESYLVAYPGTILVISHDRAFLANVTDKVFWLDRGEIKVCPRGFKHFDDWAEQLLEQEERELKNRRTHVAQEVEWASRGVKARRKRNVRRLEKMRELRDQLKEDEAAHRRATQKIEIGQIKQTDEGTKTIAEFYAVSKSFKDESGREVPILKDFSYRIRRGDRIGVLGKNGSGKTTFLRLLVNELSPDSGSVKIKPELEFSYFDQRRSQLNPEDSLQKTLIPGGGDYINVMGKDRHVCGYLKDFMFDPSRYLDKVKTLSGGQKNRLMLAKVLANPKSCLILDEPTNDLDMDTLDMLEEILSNYKGTLIVVSHDRHFLDQCVTKILAFEGEAKILSNVGGYSDYLEYRKKQAAKKAKAKNNAPSPGRKESSQSDKNNDLPDEKTRAPARSKPGKPVKLSYKDQRDYERLPDKIENLRAKIKELTSTLSDPDFYQRDPEDFHETTKKLQECEARLDRYETRWLELDELVQ